MSGASLSEVRNQLFIGGEWVDAADGATFETLNPATGEVITAVAEAREKDVDRAVESARAALRSDGWRRIDPHRRAELLWRLADLIEKNADEIARLETADNGKPFFESLKVDLPSIVENFRYFAGLADKIEGETIPVSGSFLNYTLREPVGVVGCIVPWNFPLSLAAWKVAPALACGNAVILKPAEETPLTALRLGELATEADFPPGVLNVVPGFGETAGAALVRHPGVDAIAFTGSTEVGKLVMREAAATLKKVSLELGGKSPQLVFEDADPNNVAMGMLAGIFAAGGQTCVAGSRAFVHASLYDEICDLVAERAGEVKVGDPLDDATDLGPLAVEAQRDKVERYVEVGLSENATLRAGGKRPDGLGDGWFYLPTVFSDVRNEMRLARDEIFGPVLAVGRFEDDEEAIRVANDTPYGLAAGVWTQNLSRAHTVASRLDAGTVWINTYRSLSPLSPFGGFKDSGMGKENGTDAVHEYTRVKSVWVNLDTSPIGDPFVGR